MQTGKVKFFNKDKGYGFIKEDETGKDYFTHISVVEGEVLNENDNVTFEGEETEKGLSAFNISVITD